MARINKLALTRLALKETLADLDTKELLCVLVDMYMPPMKNKTEKDEEAPRWYGNGEGNTVLDQGFYNHITTFRRVSSLWSKIVSQTENLREEMYSFRDFIVQKLTDRGVDLSKIQETTNE